ncbi:MAG TPA: OB-fold nucleic acid binding domain-containing protein [Candidatus Limnocylindria bacterium]|nr:OB-fold nucleic acid binding domain-containing protein [Candidatus Limnocylindria bacterium]
MPPPSITRSGVQFSVEGEGAGRGIRFGLSAIKSLGEKAAGAIITEREARGPYRDIYDFCHRMEGGMVNKRAVEALIKAGCFDGLGANRVQCMQVYEGIMDSDQKSRRGNHKDQMSLFDAARDEGHDGVERRYPDLPEYPPHALLAMEKEVTGVYVSGHPLDSYTRELDALPWSARALEELAEQDDRGLGEDGRRIELGGLVTLIKQKATKGGGLMAFVTLEDLTGQAECLFFPRVWEQAQPLLKPDEAWLFSGRLSVQEDRPPTLLVDRVRPLRSAEEKPKEEPRDPLSLAKEASRKLYLHIDRSMMGAAESLLKRLPGDIPVFIRLRDEEQTLLAPRDWWVLDADDARADLLTIFGADQVKVVKRQQWKG